MIDKLGYLILQAVHHRDLGKVRQDKQINSSQAYDNGSKNKKLNFAACWPHGRRL